MNNLKKLTFILLILSSGPTFAEMGSFWCFFMDFQGCPGVRAKSGNARNINNTGVHGIGNIGAKRKRVEKRTIIKIPDHIVRKIKRFFGFGGNIIKISSTVDSSHGCYEKNHTSPKLGGTLFKEGTLSECMNALTNDLRDNPRGLQLNIVQCQHFFCEPTFISKFEEYLRAHPEQKIKNVDQFLTCNTKSVEI